MSWRLAAFLGAFVCLSAARDARADDAQTPVQTAPPAAQPAPSTPPAEHKSGVYWHEEWPRFSVGEALISAAVTLRNNDIGGALDGPRSATIKFEVPILDHGARDIFKGNTQSRRDAAARISDVGFRSLVLMPYVLDVGLGAIALHRNFDVAAQLALIDFEVLTLAGMTQLLGSRIIGRARPYVDTCPPEGCSGGPYRSFLSGHAMASFTAAGLMCVHHEMLPLYGVAEMDRWACIWGLSVASFTSTMRLVADQHWASDVLIGAGMGWLYGYFLPKLLHFHAKKLVAKTKVGTDGTITWIPTATATADGATVGVLASF